jgi:thioredoxin 2
MTTDMNAAIVSCLRCGQKNRVAPGKAGPVCGRCGAPLPQAAAREDGAGATGRPIDVTDANYATEALQSPLPVLLDCWAPWCGPCRAVAPSIERLAAAYAGRAKVCKLDTDQNPRTARALGVQGIPALFFLVGGRVVDHLVGAHPYETIERKLNEAISRAAG